ncbi:hypothetical protein [Thalassovita gelatinovora]|uniref:hypothetical protein n=1 Tax=Thalassovita gelatinovora TaxID=53501 RepID=UPI00071E28AA|nr:hypothetical protein [Thalassovita gelatinovora]QIZ79547.1 hypothetical protein HFZ77_03165 [Thalassovita gelatinovora]
MTLIRPDEDGFPLAQTLAEIEEVFFDLKADVKRLQARLRDGELAAVKEAGKVIADLRGWLRIAYELEATFHERQRKQAGIEREYAVDFDQARDQIRCRLDRLRRCCYERSISGRSE